MGILGGIAFSEQAFAQVVVAVEAALVMDVLRDREVKSLVIPPNPERARLCP